MVIHYRSSAREAEALAGELAALGVSAWTVQQDLASPDTAGALIDKALDAAGPLDFLINSASIFPEHSIRTCTLEDLNANLDVNAWSPLFLTRQFAQAPSAKAVVNLLDTRVADYDWAHAAYHLSKRMLHSLTEILALEYAPGIRINGVAPGLILPPEGKTAAYAVKIADTLPLRRQGSPAEVAEAVLFLLRQAFITGQVLYVDGGRHLQGRRFGNA